MIADDIGKPFAPARSFGYSCQTVLSKRVNEFLHPGTYYCWYSLELNPATGGNSSNPLWLYQTLSHAVQTKDVNDRKIRDIRTSLMAAVTSGFPISGNPEAGKCIIQISHAVIELYRPQLWRVNLASVGSRASAGYQYPDERKVEDLLWSEFEVVVE
jgi:hypothetical protein